MRGLHRWAGVRLTLWWEKTWHSHSSLTLVFVGCTHLQYPTVWKGKPQWCRHVSPGSNWKQTRASLWSRFNRDHERYWYLKVISIEPTSAVFTVNVVSTNMHSGHNVGLNLEFSLSNSLSLFTIMLSNSIALLLSKYSMAMLLFWSIAYVYSLLLHRWPVPGRNLF